MTVPSSDAIFGFGPQPAKGTLPTTWYRHAAARVDVGSQQLVGQFPPEISGGFHPTGAYKGMAFGAGNAVVQPRLENVLGWLVYAVVGQESGVQVDTPETGLNRHIFTPPDRPRDMKWLAIRKYIPGATDNDELGEVLKDARVAGMMLEVTPPGPVQATFTFVGREPKLQESIDSGDAYAWSWGNTIERPQSVPIATTVGGYFSVNGVAQKATTVRVMIANDYTTPQEELIVGSPYPDDFIMKQQVLTFDWVYKWQDHTLYKQLLSGETASNPADANGYYEWWPVPHTSTAEVVLVSPGDISGHSNPYRLRVYAPEVAWRAEGPPQLVSNGWLAIRLTGIAQMQISSPTFQVELDNEVSAYTWPS